MKRSNNQGFLVRYQYPQKLIKWRESISSHFKTIQPADDPLEPFMTVTDDVLSVRDAKNGLRLAYLLPLVIGLWVLSFLFVGKLGTNTASINTGLERIERYQEMELQGLPFSSYHQENYEYYKLMFGENGRYSFLGYTRAVLAHGTETQREFLITYSILSAIVVSLTGYFTLFFIRTPKPANIYFDRKRQIVYTWFSGRLAACRFENLGFLERKTGMELYLYCENKKRKGGYNVVPIIVQPTGKVHLNTERDNDYFIAQIFNFMDSGKSAVITGESFHRSESHSYFRIDKRPEPFEERLEKLLEHEHEL
ncbi:hypothetical protein, partial [Vibrio mexicanus]|uniref:hypothetical protein n=1 Tax=Vibrio mexicanus TaxID=1004326 RepID=UPI0012F96FD4